MLLIYDGNSEIVARMRSNLCCFICRYCIRCRAVIDPIFFTYLLACAKCSKLPYYHASAMILTIDITTLVAASIIRFSINLSINFLNQKKIKRMKGGKVNSGRDILASWLSHKLSINHIRTGGWNPPSPSYAIFPAPTSVTSWLFQLFLLRLPLWIVFTLRPVFLYNTFFERDFY